MATIDTYTLNILVNGEPNLKVATADADNLGKKLNDLNGNTLNNFKQKMGESGAASKAFGENVNVAREQSEKLVAALVGLGAIEFVKKLLEGADATTKLAQTFGLTVASTLELQAAFAKVGIDGDKSAKVMLTLADNMQKLKDGDPAMIAGFKTLGLSFADIQAKGMSVKDVMLALSENIAKAKGSTETLSAANLVTGKNFAKKDAQEFADTLKSLSGTQEKAAESTKSLGEIQNKLEANAIAVKTAFLELIAPVAKFFAEITSSGENAKLIAEAIAVALTAIVSTYVVKGFLLLVESIKSLSVWLGITSGATGVAAKVTGDLVAVQFRSIQASMAQAVGYERVLSATMALNVEQIKLDALMAEGIVAGNRYDAQLLKTTAAEGRLALMQEARTLTLKGLNIATEASVVADAAAGVSALGTAAKVEKTVETVVKAESTMYKWGYAIGNTIAALVIAVSSWGAFTAAVSAGGAALVALVGIPALVVAGLIAIDRVLSHWDLSPIDWLASKLDDLVRSHFPSVMAGLDSIGHALGLAPNPGEAKANAPSGPKSDLQRGGNTATMAEQMAIDHAMIEAGAKQLDQLAGQKKANDLLVASLRLQEQLERNKIVLQDALIGKSALEKIAIQGTFDFETKRYQELQRINGEIAKTNIESANAKDGEKARFAVTLSGLAQQKKYWTELKDGATEMRIEEEKSKQVDATRLAMLGIETKANEEVLKLKDQILMISMSTNEKVLYGIQQQIDAETRAEIKRQEAKLGTGEKLGKPEQQAIANKVKSDFGPALDEANALNVATAKHNELLFTAGIANQAIDDSIKARSAIEQLTMTTNQKIIRQMQEQLELAIQAEVVRRETSENRKLEPAEIDKITDALTRAGKAQQGVALEQQKTANDFSTGWSAASNQYLEDMQDMNKKGADSFGALSTSINQAIDTFVQTGKFSFADMATSFAKMLLQMEMKALAAEAMGWFKSLFSGGSGGGGGGSIISSLFSFFKADGGDVAAGKMGVVGEKGPEVFIPKVPGTIIPNNKLGSLGVGGGGGQVVNNNTSVTNNHYTVNAVDAKSVAQLFAENRKQLLGTVRMAQAEQPYAARL